MLNFLAILIVNILTTLRIIGVFALLPVYLNFGGGYAALLAAGCYFTDCLDGIIARKCHASTFFGSMYDVVADKMFTVANLFVLVSITRFAIIPIIFEITIIIIQSIKFHKNVNVKSTMIGKIKTWVMGITVVLIYLIVNINHLSFLGNTIINFFTSANQNVLYLIIFTPLYIFEVLSLISYLTFLEDYNPDEKIELSKLRIKLKKPKTFKDKWDNFCTMWLNNSFYEEYKDSAGLKDIRKYLKENR